MGGWGELGWVAACQCSVLELIIDLRTFGD